MFPRVCTAFLIWMMASSSSLAFAPPHVGTHQQSHQCRSGRLQHSMFPNCRQRSILYSTPSEDEGAPPNESITTTTTSNDVKKSEPTVPEGTQYPINLPSPLLLASGMILAIVCTGSTFQLTSGTPPPYGVPTTAGIVVLGFPACFYLLYAAILKGIAETEEDDKTFLSGK